MLYLTGVTSDRAEPALIAAGIGLMITPLNGYINRADRYPVCAMDNSCYPDRFNEDSFLRKVEMLPKDRLLFVVCPDVYPDPVASLQRGLQYAPLIRELGAPAAIVAQDGAERLDWPWEEFNCLFIGGERRADPRQEWKIS